MSSGSDNVHDNRTAEQKRQWQELIDSYSPEMRARIKAMQVAYDEAKRFRAAEQHRAAKRAEEDEAIRGMLLKAATQPPPEGTNIEQPSTEGPCHPYTWQHEGKVIDYKLQPKAWHMVNHLWKQPRHSASFDDLKKPVYDDAEQEAGENEFGSLRRAANSYFKKYKIPLLVKIKKRVVSLLPTK